MKEEVWFCHQDLRGRGGFLLCPPVLSSFYREVDLKKSIFRSAKEAVKLLSLRNKRFLKRLGFANKKGHNHRHTGEVEFLKKTTFKGGKQRRGLL